MLVSRSFLGAGMTARRPSQPPGLAAAGRALWRAVVSAYVLRADEVALLAHACRTADLIAALQAELESAPVMVPGSQGQSRAHPLLTEVRGQRQLLAALLKQLGLPDTASADADDGRPSAASAKARKAARSRWGNPYGGSRGA